MHTTPFSESGAAALPRIRPTRALINSSAVEANVRTLKKIAGTAAFMAVVKADGYGHGALTAANAAQSAGADCLGVALLEEALSLRQQGVTLPIHILGGIPPQGADLAAAHRIMVTLTDPDLLPALAAAADRCGRPMQIQLKVDTGMHRIGFQPRDVPEMAARITRTPGLILDGLMTHLATADETDLTHARQQIDRFTQTAAAVKNRGIDPGTLNAANTAGTIALPESRLDRVRCGIGIYGLYPDNHFRDRIRLCPALTLETRIVFIKDVPAGAGISYGRTYLADRPMRIATLPIGYADGYHRILSNRAWVRIGGKACPVRGRICMDMCMVDISDLPHAAIGDPVILIGRDDCGEISAESVAEWAETINYEITSAITARIPREAADTPAA